MAAWARSSARCQRASHGVPVAPLSRLASSRHTSVGSATTRTAAECSGSIHAGPPTWICTAPEAASHWLSTLEAGGGPRRSTTPGV